MKIKSIIQRYNLYVVFTIAVMGILVSCSSGGSNSNIPQPTKGTIMDYTNATWLFDNYYALYDTYTNEEKEELMLELKQYANGFAIESQDPNGNINLAISIFHQEMSGMINSPGGIEDKTLMYIDDMEEYIDKDFVPESFTNEQMALMIAAGEGMNEDIESDLQLFSTIAQQYNVPYQLSESIQQYIMPNYDDAQLDNKFQNKAILNTWRHPDLNSWNWWHGDVAITTGSDGFRRFGFALMGHAAMVATYQQPNPIIIEANGNGVVISNDINKWGTQYKDIAAYHPLVSWDKNLINTNGTGSYLRGLAVNYALQQKGKSYNFNFFSPGNTGKFYCSSLVWNSYNYAAKNTSNVNGKVLFKWDNLYDFPKLYDILKTSEFANKLV